MKILFHLEYQTTFGEELAVNIEKDGKTEQHKMGTLDGYHWTYELTKAAKTNDHIDYFYSVMRGEEQVRTEWIVEPHHLEFTAQKGSRYTVYDHWIDIPEDAFLYSTAFTDCVAARKVSKSKETSFPKTVRLKVRAPQLRNFERLAILGAGEGLGNWEALRAIEMVEHSANEWVVSLDADKLPQTLEFKFVGLDEVDDVTPLWEEGENRKVSLPKLEKNDVVVYELSQAHFPIYPWKGAGTVIPIFSLRSEGSFGVGDFGDLKMFVDWCDKTKQRVLQVLPINDTTITHTWQDSYPYNSISIYALHPQYTDLRQLPAIKDEQQRLGFEVIRKELNALPQIDYERVNNAKMDYLRVIYQQEGSKMMKTQAFKQFFDQNKEWLVPYAAYCHYRDLYGTATFSEWPDHHTLPAKEREAMTKPSTKIYKEVAFWYFVQFNLDQQMRAAHKYARSKRVILKGDIPIGISRDGVEAWVEPKYFRCLLSQWSELGLPNLRLGCDAERRLQLVGTSFQKDGRVFRCLSYRPRTGLLPYLGNPHRFRSRIAGSVLTLTRNDPRGNRGIRSELQGGVLHQTIHCRLDAGEDLRRESQRGKGSLPALSAR